MDILPLSAIGDFANRLLTHAQVGSVIGVASRGLFLHLASGWIVYISNEAQRGPLTLNCTGQGDLFKSITCGEKVEISPGKINLPTIGMVIDLSQATPWQAPPLPTDLLPPDQRKDKLALIARLVHARQPASPLAGLLPILTGFVQQTPAPIHTLAPQIDALRCFLVEGQITRIISSLGTFLGLGSGLTPSGDDLVMGFLLALRRWGGVLAPALLFSDLARQLLPLAYQRTTTLSANLLECASLGQADERLLLALDGMMTGAPDPPACAAALAAWGNTSGHDALVGMALALQDRWQAS